MSVIEIQNMTVAERLQAMEQLWESLCQNPRDLDSPAWHEDVLRRRKERVEAGGAEFFTVEQLKERFGR
ncbi:MAG: addiction module protein [Verrucomicrobiota bacterium]